MSTIVETTIVETTIVETTIVETTIVETTIVETTIEIRPFDVDISDEALEDLRRRIAAVRLPSRELVDDRAQGVQLATIQELSRYWATDYDWRKCEAKLNALPQFKTEINGEDIHLIHVKSRHENALPLIVTRGWPGSVIELLEVIGPLTDPTAHGGRAEDAFGLVLPSLPGDGFSAADRGRLGPWPRRLRLGGADAPPRIRALRRPGRRPGRRRHRRDRPAGARRAAWHPHEPARGGAGQRQRDARGLRGGTRGARRGHHVQNERPRLLPGAGHAAADDRLRPARFTRRAGGLDPRPRHGQLLQDLPRLCRRAALGPSHPGRILDNITLYWLTGTGVSAARSYWEGGRAAALAAGQAPPPVSIPIGFTTFPGEIFRAPRSWVDQAYPNLTYFNEVDKGGHFAAWAEPEPFSEEIRAAFRALREQGATN